MSAFDKHLLVHKLTNLFESGTLEDQVKFCEDFLVKNIEATSIAERIKFCEDFLIKHIPQDDRIKKAVTFLELVAPERLHTPPEDKMADYREALKKTKQFIQTKQFIPGDTIGQTYTGMIDNPFHQPLPPKQVDFNDFNKMVEAMRKRRREAEKKVIYK